MKVVSRLVKMEVRLGSLERKGEEILSRSDPASDTAQTKMYISPDDLVGLAKLINSSVVGYLFLFPIFYTARFLRQIESRKGSLTKIWERTAILFGCLLIWGGVAGVPFPASLLLFFLPFSIFFLLIAFYNRKGDFIYPMAFLQGVSIYLLARFFSLQDLQIPLLGSLLVLIWFWLARRWETRRELALSLYRSGYWAASFFTYEVLRTFFQRGVEKDPALFWMIPPLLIFALYFWACYFQAKKRYLQQLAIAIMAIGYILLIFAIPSLPLEYLGPGLVLFAMG
ncbi:MAG: hypothetical protein HY697_04400, partial [Deltaproteobacteria bacterium]|nr:hypothetical protein [Deltaproteobacteria bacterium]